MSSNSNDSGYGVFVILLLIAALGDQYIVPLFEGWFASASDEPVPKSYHHTHAHAVTGALPSPLPLPSPFPTVETGSSWGWFGWTLLVIALIAIVIYVYCKLGALRDEIDDRVRSIERTVKGHQKQLDEHHDIPESLRALGERIKEDRAELQGHRKMLRASGEINA